MPTVHVAPLREIEPVTLYAILRLRVDVFVVEQDCPYAELDGRDLEPSAMQLWTTSEDGEVLATLRLLTDPSGDRRIGRVTTARPARGSGLAAALINRAIELSDGAPIVLDAQSQLQGWYERFGFSVVGEAFVEDGIPHVPMRRGPVGELVETQVDPIDHTNG